MCGVPVPFIYLYTLGELKQVSGVKLTVFRMTDKNTFFSVTAAGLIINLVTKTIDHVSKIPCLSLSSFLFLKILCRS